MAHRSARTGVVKTASIAIVRTLAATLLPPMLTTAAMAASSNVTPDYAFQRVRGAAKGSTASVAANPAHGFRAVVGPDGIQVVRADDGWQVSLTVRACGSADDLVPVDPAGLEIDGARAELRRGAVVEWYVNDHRGLEQGFTVLNPPTAGDTGSLVVEMDLATELVPLLAADGSGLTSSRRGLASRC